MTREELCRAYYQEHDPQKRKDYLAQLEESGEDKMLALRQQLFCMRYGDLKSPKDTFLLSLMRLIQMKEQSFLFPSRGQKEICRLLAVFGVEDALSYGEEGAAVLHEELCNAVARYFVTCQDAGYKRKYFGLMSASEEEKREHVRKDALAMGVDPANRYHMQEAFAPLIRAVKETYARMFPEEPPLT